MPGWRRADPRSILPGAVIVLAALVPAARSMADQITPPSTHGPTQEELNRADVDPTHWLMDNKGYMGYRYSKLSSIDAGNAGNLKQVCSFKVGTNGSFQTGPIVYDGVLYATTAFKTFAIDASNCQKVWEYDYSSTRTVTPNSKGLAIAQGRVIRGTPDGHLIALDAKTGALLWDKAVMNPVKGEFATAAPLVWNDMVFMGKAGADRGIRGEMMAFSASDGHQIWSFYTVPSPGQTGSETWKKKASIEHGGGSIWTAFSLDPEAGLLLLPVGNPGPDFDNDSRPGTNLFTNSLVALDAKTGRLKWWYQLVAPDDRDWDTDVVAAFDSADNQKLAAVAGKDGVIHVVDRTNGKQVSAAPLVTRYEGTTGPVPKGSGIRVCPIAAVEWNGPSYSPDTKMMYMTAVDWCAQAIKGVSPAYKQGQEYLGWANYYGTRDSIDQAFGVFNAIDPLTGNVAWRKKLPGVPLAGITATAGGIVMTGSVDGNFYVLDAGTGNELLKTNLGVAIDGGVITYEAKGKQYVAAAAGDNNLTFGVKGENTIVVLSLP